MRPKYALRRVRGVSLVEALVAMAIMAFGMLAVVGVQGTLRVNADIAKQRSEATRLAEAELETVRAFTSAGSGTGSATEFDNLTDKGPTPVTSAQLNTTYQVERKVSPLPGPGVIRPTISVAVSVTWKNRLGDEQTITVRDVVSRVDPVLSGMAVTRKTITPVGKREGRHPTIPVEATNLTDDPSASIFSPPGAGNIAWTFNNATGVITRICTITGPVQTTTPAVCTTLTYGAHLVSGEVRFNLRGTSNNLSADGINVMKPVPDDDIAWVISNSTGKIIRKCVVPTGVATSALTAADVTGANCTAADLTVSPFAANDAAYTLVASDSENPIWPVLPFNIGITFDSSSGNHEGPNGEPSQCFSSAMTVLKDDVTSATPMVSGKYFCIIIGNALRNWMGRTTVVPQPFFPSIVPKWTINTGATNYKVCRYTQASTDFTENADHPKDYGKWVSGCGSGSNPACRPVEGNLINQNFLVINGNKSCPTDVAANPLAGNLVNSNTRPHQP